ncbi:MAG TPA: cytochrome d ubiquinol oxidase subunit II, partial [Anaeromyxobacter sp.]|nr:cytochrome d ubiquinol oxidase subunit II [Anaeromyxobacter sp.]
MATLFFCFLAFMLAAYAVLDGYDLGTGILHLRLAGDDAERRQLLRTIGPLWDGNEVFLVAAGGTLFFAFPTLYATSFSGFYLPLIMVLWLLVLRGVSIDLRSHLESPLWRAFFDVVFSLSSALLAFFLGVALGNVVRGVPIGPDLTFFQPLWDTGRDPGILDGYTVLVGLTALATLALQGATWAAHRTTGAVHDRARNHVRPLWALTGFLTAATTVATWAVQPR